MNRINEICQITRRSGNTLWILKGTVKNPNCVIVCKDKNHLKYMNNMYHYLLSTSPWYLKIYWRVFGRKHPKFLTLDSNFSGHKGAVIFDNASLYDETKNNDDNKILTSVLNKLDSLILETEESVRFFKQNDMRNSTLSHEAAIYAYNNIKNFISNLINI